MASSADRPADQGSEDLRFPEPSELDAAASAAVSAFEAAGDLDALALAKTAHLGDRSPIALARRALGLSLIHI